MSLITQVRRNAKHEAIQKAHALERTTANARDNARDRKVENKLDGIFNQKVRYLQSIAIEERTRLK